MFAISKIKEGSQTLPNNYMNIFLENEFKGIK